MKTIAAVFSFFLLHHYSSNGQLCNGSLGDPVVNITFGAGSGVGPALPDGVSSYKYVTSDCPADGEYTLRNLSFNCFDNTWHLIAGDHTPDDANGYFMLVNASFNPGDFFVDTINGLCGSTTYEFSAWVANVLRPTACNNGGTDPNLTFKIETTTGAVLASYNSGNIQESFFTNWKQYGLFFQTPAGNTTVVVRITNNSPGGCGNDLVLDDIMFRPCGPLVNAVVASSGETTIDICAGNNTSVLLSGNYSEGYSDPAFQWQTSTNGINWSNIPGASSVNYLYITSSPGVFKYRMLIAESSNFHSPQCRIASSPVTINVNPLPRAQATNYILGCFGSDVVLFAAGGSSYQWTGPNGFNSNVQMPVLAKIQYSHSGLYKVTVTSNKGCSNSDSTTLQVYPNAIASATEGADICEGTSTVLSASGGVHYKWFPSTHLSSDSVPNPVAIPNDSTLYHVIVTNQYGCADTATVAVNVWKKPVANAGPDKKTRVGLPVRLSGSVQGTDVSYFWSAATYLNNPALLQPLATPPQNIFYKLEAISDHGCGKSSDVVFVKVYDRVIIPNVFSPNGDGINDTWIIEPLELFEDSETEVYNRFGQLVYRSKGYVNPWNGTRNRNPLPVGVYYYSIDLKINKEPRLTGSVLIIR